MVGILTSISMKILVTLWVLTSTILLYCKAWVGVELHNWPWRRCNRLGSKES